MSPAKGSDHMVTDGVLLDGATVLIVEDECIIAEYASDVLTACAANVAVANNVAEARSILQSSISLDAAVLNVNIAGRVSYPLAERLAEARIPFAFASGFDHLKLRVDGFGSVAWLPKPYTPRKLLTMVRGLIGARLKRAALSRPSSSIVPA